jgi:hypothetical protein
MFIPLAERQVNRVTAQTAVDWQQITISIRRNYKSLATVAKEVGSDWRHLCRLARAEVNEPKYSVGLKLLAIHEKHCTTGGSNVAAG